MQKFSQLLILLILLSALYVSAQNYEALGSGLNAIVYEIVPFRKEKSAVTDIYVAGGFTNAGGNPDADYIARWDGSQWHAVAPGLTGPVYTIAFGHDRIYVGGSFTNAGGNQKADNIAYWDGLEWQSMGTGFKERITTIAIHGDRVYAGGFFSNLDAFTNHIAYWEGDSWYSLGHGVNGNVNTIKIWGDEIFVGGDFTDAGGNEDADYIARWGGTYWHSVGSELHGSVSHIYIADNTVYAGGLFLDGVVRLAHGGWEDFNHGPPLVGFLTEIAVFENNIILTSPGDGAFLWNGTAWIMLSMFAQPIMNTPWALAVKEDYIYMGGEFDMHSPGTQNIVRFKHADFTSTAESDYTDRNSLEVFPNPFDDVICFTLKEEYASSYELTITDVRGQVMLKKHTAEREIETSHLSTGLYFLHVVSKGKSAMAKMIKQ